MEPDLVPGDPFEAAAPPQDPTLGRPETLLLVEEGGIRVLGAPTVDSDHDGTADTVAAPGSGPDVLAVATDLDDDGVVDVLTTIHTDGTATTTHPGRDGPWELLRDLDPDLDRHRPAGPAPPAPTLDPDTGTWTRTV